MSRLPCPRPFACCWRWPPESFAQAACADGPTITGLGYKPMIAAAVRGLCSASNCNPQMYSGNIGQIIMSQGWQRREGIIVSKKASLQESGLAFAAARWEKPCLYWPGARGCTLPRRKTSPSRNLPKSATPMPRQPFCGRAAVAFMKGNRNI